MPPAVTRAGPVLVLDAALGGCMAGVVDGAATTERRAPGGRGSAAALPALARDALAHAGVDPASLAAVAVTVGPGSFTGIRAALALGHGIALAAGCPIRGAGVAAAIRAGLGDAAGPVWVVIDSRRGHVFLDRGAGPEVVPLDALPTPDGPVLLAGDAAATVLPLLPGAALAGVAVPAAAGIAAAPPCPPVPLYVDPVAARPNPARPAPA